MSGKRHNRFAVLQHSHNIEDMDVTISYHRLTGRVQVFIDQRKVLSRLTWLSPFINHTFYMQSTAYRLRIKSFFSWSAKLYCGAVCCSEELLPARRKQVEVRWITSSIPFLTRLLSKVL